MTSRYDDLAEQVVKGEKWPTGGDRYKNLADSVMNPGILGQRTHDATTSFPSYYEEIGKAKGQVDTTGRGYLPGKGVQDFMTRFHMASGDTLPEKQNELRNLHPKAQLEEFKTSDGKKVLIFHTPDGGWDVVDQDLSVNPQLNVGGDLLYDAADAASAAWEVAPEVLAGFISPGSVALPAIGAMGGRLLKEVYQWARQTQDQELASIAKDTAVSGGASYLGGLLGRILGASINVGKGGVSSTALDAQKIKLLERAEDLGLDPLMIHQIANSPLLQRMGAQSEAVNAFLGDVAKGQSDSALRRLMNMRLAARSGKSLDEVAKELAAGEKKLLDDAVRPLVGGGTTDDVGRGLQDGFGEFDALDDAGVNLAYDQARAAESPTFDANRLQGKTATIKRGDLAKGQAQPTPRDVVQHERGTISHPQPKPSPDVQVSGDPAGEVRKVMDDILRMDPNIADFKGTDAMDQLKQLRTRLGPYTQPPPGTKPGHVEAAARKLWGEISAVMDNPQNADEAFKTLWSRASRLAQQRFERLDNSTLINMAKSDRPAELANNLFSGPFGVDDLKTVKANLTAPRWQQFRREALNYYGHRPDELGDFLDNADPETLDLLFSKESQKVLGDVATEIRRIRGAGLADARLKQTKKDQFFAQLIDNDSSAYIEKLYEMSGPEARKDIRAAILDRIANASKQYRPGKPGKGDEMLNPNKMRFELERVLRVGFRKFLTSEDVQLVRDLARYLDVVYQGSDAGTSILGAEIASQFQQALKQSALGHPVKAVNTWVRLQEMKIFGRIMASPRARHLLLGRGKKPIDVRWLRAFGATLGTISKDMYKKDGFETPHINTFVPPVRSDIPATDFGPMP